MRQTPVLAGVGPPATGNCRVRWAAILSTQVKVSVLQVSVRHKQAVG